MSCCVVSWQCGSLSCRVAKRVNKIDPDYVRAVDQATRVFPTQFYSVTLHCTYERETFSV